MTLHSSTLGNPAIQYPIAPSAACAKDTAATPYTLATIESDMVFSRRLYRSASSGSIEPVR